MYDGKNEASYVYTSLDIAYLGQGLRVRKASREPDATRDMPSQDGHARVDTGGEFHCNPEIEAPG